MKKLDITPEEMKIRRSKQGLESYHRNKEKEHVKLTRQKYRTENPEKFKKQRHESYLRNKEYVLEYSSINYQKNKERELARAKTKYQDPEFRQKKRDYDKQYVKANRRQLAEKNKERYAKDIQFKLRTNLNGCIRQKLKQQHSTKDCRTLELIGCSIPFLMDHLEKQFKPKMHWLNNTPKGWHIDHIIPCSSFDLTNKEEQQKCFHYTNLQPLWWFENLIKNDMSPEEWEKIKHKIPKYYVLALNKKFPQPSL